MGEEEKTMMTRTCPVCGHEQDQEKLECTCCGWDFSPLLGTPDQVEARQRERIEQAQIAWRQRRYNPELIPELERDPFETTEEFAARLAERPWYAGDFELRKAEYDIETGRFPLSIQLLQTWAKPWLDPAGSYSLNLPRDQARELYQRGATWPLYARLAVIGSKVSLSALVAVTPDGELPVTTKAIEVQAIRCPTDASCGAAGPLISGRYRDLGDGTLMDIRTGLQWMRCALGQRWNGRTCAGDAGSWTWNNLNDQVRGINKQGYGGHTDWRVPTIDELKTLIVEDARPAIDLEAFPETPCRWFWSSTPYAYSSSSAWGVHFDPGYVYSGGRASASYVRLVRGGKLLSMLETAR